MMAAPRLVFVDANVLIAAARGTDEPAIPAVTLLGDPSLQFASSSFVRLKVLPKSVFNRRAEEAAFYNTCFNAVVAWASVTEALMGIAYEEAARTCMAAMDALHVAAAAAIGADELVTTERLTKPLHRATLVRVRTLHP